MHRWLVAALGLAAALPAYAQSCTPFADVPASDPFCTNIQWMYNRGITLGCTATAYCPTQFVRRDQMAAFMNRLGNVVFQQGGNAFGRLPACAVDVERVGRRRPGDDVPPLVAGTIVVNTPPTSGSHINTNSVAVLLTTPATRFFSQIYSDSQVTLHARGVATANTGGQACILALDPTASGAVTFTGNNLTLINGCNVMSNSLSNSALVVSGSADVTVPCVLSAGGVSVDDGLNLTDCSEPQSNVPPANDPFAGLPQPPVSGPCLTLPSTNAAATLSPGRYCGGGNLRGVKTFLPGVYVMDGGTFRMNATANVSGSGVTFFMTNNATTDWNGSAQVSLSAPTSGTYKHAKIFVRAVIDVRKHERRSRQARAQPLDRRPPVPVRRRHLRSPQSQRREKLSQPPHS